MMMNKNYYIYVLLVAACLAAGCRKSEPDRTGYISFTAAVAPEQTKADPTSKTLTDGTLGTYAWKTTATWASTAEASKLSTPYIVNAETTYSGSAWHPGTYRWPASGYLHFICYGPYKVSSPITYSLDSGIGIKDYTVGTDDLVYSSILTDRTSATGAAIELNHALGKVVVKVKTDEAPTGVSDAITSAKVTLTSLSIDSLKTKGSFTSSSSSWSSLSGKENKSLFSGTEELSSSTAYESISAIYVMPQEFEDSLQAMRLSYEVEITYKNGTTTSSTINDEIHYLKGLTSASGWEPGKCAAYTITVSAFTDKVSFSATTEAWDKTDIGGNLGGGDK